MEDIKNIFASLLVGGIDLKEKVLNDSLNHTDWYRDKRETYKYAYPIFFSRVSINIFKGEYYFLYELLKDTNTNVFTYAQLGSLLDRHKKRILKSSAIDLNSIGGIALDLNTDARFDVFKGNVLSIYKKYILLD